MTKRPELPITWADLESRLARGLAMMAVESYLILEWVPERDHASWT